MRGSGIERLPPEVLAKVYGYLWPADLKAVGHASRSLYFASLDDKLWRIWAKAELQSWCNWRLEVALGQESCREFVLKCMAAEDWLIKELLAAKQNRVAVWNRYTVADVCDVHVVGALKRLAECYTPKGALYWWGRVMPPPELWIESHNVRVAEHYRTDKDTPRYSPYAGREVPSSWEAPLEVYRPAMLRWVPDRWAYSGFSWRDGADALQLYMMCRRILGVQVLVDVWSHDEAAEKWDLLDAFDAIDGYRLDTWDVAHSFFRGRMLRDTWHIATPPHILERLYPVEASDKGSDNDQATGSLSAYEFCSLLLEFYSHTQGWLDVMENELDGKRVIPHILRELAVHFADARYNISIPTLSALVDNGPDDQFIISVYDRSVIKVAEVDDPLTYGFGFEAVPGMPLIEGPQMPLDFAQLEIRDVDADRADIRCRHPLLRLLTIEDASNEDWELFETEPEATRSVPLRPPRRLFWEHFVSVLALPERYQEVLASFLPRPLAQYLIDDCISVSALHPDPALDRPTPPRFRIGDLVAVRDPYWWGVVMDYAPNGIHTSQGQTGPIYETQVGHWSAPNRLQETDFVRTRQHLNDGEVPLRCGVYLMLGRSLSYIDNGRFVANYEALDA